MSSSEKSPVVGPGKIVTYGGLHGNALLYAIVGTATTGFSLFGYDQGLMSGIIASDQFNTEFPATYQHDVNDVHAGTVQGTVTSCYEVGCFLGALFAYFFGERMGRRRVMFMGAIIMIIGTIISVCAFGPGDPRGNVGGFVQFIVGRVITGVGNGANTATIPSWVAESSKAHNRGFLICMEASTVAVGTVIAYWIDFGLSFVNSSVSWRFPIALQILFALILIGGVMVLPESPRWLIAHGYDHEGLRVIAALDSKAEDDPVAIADRNKVSDAIAAQQNVKSNRRRDILKGGKNQHFRRAMVGASTQLFQQIGGCNAVIYYSTVLFENQIGLETTLALILGGVLSIVYAIFALTSFFLVERVGRRKLFLIGTFGQAAAMFITFGCLLPGDAQSAKGGAFGLYLFIAFFGATWLPLPWLYPAELNSMAVRTQANAISTMVNWLFNFTIVQVLPTMTASIGAYTFLFFACINCVFLPFIYLFYPETTGRTLEELDVIFAHAHLTERRPTLVAAELPKLTDFQVQEMTDRYEIHGGAADTENPSAYGAPINAGAPDTSLPPKHPQDDPNYYPDGSRRPSGGTGESGEQTRVTTPSGEKAGATPPA
ncbi:monosaccharide transporter [Cryptococcus neoformans C23]|uniref:Monosaccharide transporter n=1 Tax=Cryptococcus neoformans (strain H99 / ATCC 208821 / CBS 10515 / FGSC 9487) TaxID=235443 RepID=J9VUI4_CRYN9|nr:monosaccharide transporter [Cryptococcus neoformans var. grubii H99]AUB27959.1 monosaccharide transporter [Cryptococcus neoformans var. grubii]OWZ27653.1 monosaccharide transporter [Cryptococcus neoformans var. grubii AD2-60a]OWZ39957.1 monosaccharide transporter [Cryptococcus neoformans var. grubii C23]OWZ51036.1 monosaccharide transporter [Cryptococcus neoformans var. grubii 125.91]OXC81981.1 monosaccharide transporter [Cryptococcus neoformans var. grubii AD1-7a]OXG27610.1 monosaccharide|eukprot:XP_012052420.1 monosaccharide transporter [Cryptococcus neoformans var. grubii H99]